MILPELDSIGGFTVLFSAIMVAAAWVATTGPRLSYVGLQLALVFCIINLQEFRIQTALAPARDGIAGVLLGLFMMWLVFDQLWSAPAVGQMRKTFTATLRLLAQFAKEPLSKDLRVATDRSYFIRETINKNFEQTRALADGVLFEFGPSREQDLLAVPAIEMSSCLAPKVTSRKPIDLSRLSIAAPSWSSMMNTVGAPGCAFMCIDFGG